MSDDQPENTHDILEKEKKRSKIAPLLPFQWKKGQSGNPAGRPKGKTMKEYAKELLECQTEEERQEFLHGLPKEIIWKMAEGNPKQDNEHSGSIDATVTVIKYAKEGNTITTPLPTEKLPDSSVGGI